MKAFLWTALLALGLILPRAAAWVPHLTERFYSNGCFRFVASFLGLFTGWLRPSLAQLYLCLLVPTLLFLLGRSAARAARARSLGQGFGPAYRWVAAAAILVWSFELLWGVNYARPTLNERLSLRATQVNVERLLRLTRHLAEETNRAYRQAMESDELTEGRFTIDPKERSTVPSTPEPPSGVSEPGPAQLCLGREEISRHLVVAYAQVQPGFAGLPLSRPKYPSLLGWIMTRAGISGFYFPYTGETSVNGAMPDASIPYTAAHEMAHQRGTAREEEANFLAYLACRTCGLPCVRYSGALGAFGLASSALWKAAPDSARALHGRLLAPGPRADLAAIAAFWRRHQGPAERAATRVNDGFLRANAQREGVRSYGRAVELLVAYDEALTAAAEGTEGE